MITCPILLFSETSVIKANILSKALLNHNWDRAVAMLNEDKNLLTQSNSIGLSPLHTAISDNNPSLITWLIKQGTPLESNDYQISVLKKSLVMDHFECFKTLLKMGADPDIILKHSITLLHMTVLLNKPEYTKLLLDYSADINMKDARGMTPLQLAVYTNNMDILRVFEPFHPSLNIYNNFHETALLALIKKNNLRNLKFFIILFQNRADSFINYSTNNIDSPLMVAVKMDNVNMAKVLLESDADPNQRDKFKETPLFKAIRKENVQMIKLLLSFNANTSIINKHNVTPFRLIQISKNNSVRKLLHEINA